MTSISIESVGITRNHLETSGMTGLDVRESRKSLDYYILNSLWEAASELGG